MKLIKILSVIYLCLLVIGCNNNKSEPTNELAIQVDELDAQNTSNYQFLDFKDPFGCYSLNVNEAGVYLNDEKIESANAETFTQLGSGYNNLSYFEDKTTVYVIYRKQGCQAGLMSFPGAEMSSLQIFNVTEGLAADNHYVYKNGNVVAPAKNLSNYLSGKFYQYDQFSAELFENNNGNKEVIIADASKLSGYPSSDEACGLRLIVNLGSTLLFTYGACGGGLFYYSVVSLDLNNLASGFSSVENFYLNYREFPQTKLLGIKENNGRELFLLDLSKGLVPYKIYEALPGERFFTPSHFGEDRINYTFLGDDEILLNIYAGVYTGDIPYSDEDEVPIRQEKLDLSVIP